MFLDGEVALKDILQVWALIYFCALNAKWKYLHSIVKHFPSSNGNVSIYPLPRMWLGLNNKKVPWNVSISEWLKRKMFYTFRGFIWPLLFSNYNLHKFLSSVCIKNIAGECVVGCILKCIWLALSTQTPDHFHFVCTKSRFYAWKVVRVFGLIYWVLLPKYILFNTRPQHSD